MDIAADRDRARDWLDVGLFNEDRADAVAQRLHLRLREMLTFHELRYPAVGVAYGHCWSTVGGRKRKKAVEELNVATSWCAVINTDGMSCEEQAGWWHTTVRLEMVVAACEPALNGRLDRRCLDNLHYCRNQRPGRALVQLLLVFCWLASAVADPLISMRFKAIQVCMHFIA